MGEMQQALNVPVGRLVSHPVSRGLSKESLGRHEDPSDPDTQFLPPWPQRVQLVALFAV